MPIQLKPEQEHRIEEVLRSGAYDNQEEVIDRALDALHAQDEWRALAARSHCCDVRFFRVYSYLIVYRAETKPL